MHWSERERNGRRVVLVSFGRKFGRKPNFSSPISEANLQMYSHTQSAGKQAHKKGRRSAGEADSKEAKEQRNKAL